MKQTEKRSAVSWGLLLPGCMFAGIGLGIVFGNVKAGLFIGMGLGFIMAGILMLTLKRSE